MVFIFYLIFRAIFIRFPSDSRFPRTPRFRLIFVAQLPAENFRPERSTCPFVWKEPTERFVNVVTLFLLIKKGFWKLSDRSDVWDSKSWSPIAFEFQLEFEVSFVSYMWVWSWYKISISLYSLDFKFSLFDRVHFNRPENSHCNGNFQIGKLSLTKDSMSFTNLKSKLKTLLENLPKIFCQKFKAHELRCAFYAITTRSPPNKMI